MAADARRSFPSVRSSKSLTVRRIRLAGVGDAEIGTAEVDLDHGADPLVAAELARLVRGDGDQPGLQSIRIPQRAQLAPRDRPGRLDRIVGDVLASAGHDVGDADHVRVVRGDDPGERDRVAGRCQPHDRRCRRDVPRDHFHAQ
jgi:hypothetical protein